jgi:hypothetical protein
VIYPGFLCFGHSKQTIPFIGHSAVAASLGEILLFQVGNYIGAAREQIRGDTSQSEECAWSWREESGIGLSLSTKKKSNLGEANRPDRSRRTTFWGRKQNSESHLEG